MAQRTVADVGERRLISLIRRAVESTARGDIASLGDDAAILPRRRGGGTQVVTTDVLVEGTHWHAEHLTPRQLGRRALVVNLSDLAAMGAEPTWFTLGIGMPPSQPLAWFQGLLRGLIAGSEEFDCPLVGGDLVRAPSATLSVTVAGLCASRPVARSTARVGDRVWVTGDLGRAALALRLLDEGDTRGPGRRAVLQRHRRPMPRLGEGAALARSRAACAMMDLSDGLVSDLKWICDLSGVGAEIDLDALPLHPALSRNLAERGEDAPRFAARSGEEFELLFTTSRTETALRALLDQAGVCTPVSAIGQITARRGIRWSRRGRPVAVDTRPSFDHFSHGGGPELR